MVDVSIESLISMARDYVNKANIDTDNSGSINTDRELRRLLSGTGANSIEDLTLDSIKQKILENDTEKIFTAFMTEKNLETTSNGRGYLDSLRDFIAIHGYEHIKNGPEAVSSALQGAKQYIDIAISRAKSNDYNENIPGSVSKDYAVREGLNIAKGQLEVAKQTLQRVNMGIFQIVSESQDYVTNEYTWNVQQQLETIDNMISKINSQIKILATESEVSYDNVISELSSTTNLLSSAKDDCDNFNKNYTKILDEGLAFIKELEDYQQQFIADGVATEEEKEKAKELLHQLIEKTSPMIRNLVLKQVEEAYKHDTGINQNTDSANIKRSSFKTQTEIYTLRGNNVMVSDYNGRVLRTETLNPSVHTKFFE